MRTMPLYSQSPMPMFRVSLCEQCCARHELCGSLSLCVTMSLFSCDEHTSDEVQNGTDSDSSVDRACLMKKEGERRSQAGRRASCVAVDYQTFCQTPTSRNRSSACDSDRARGLQRQKCGVCTRARVSRRIPSRFSPKFEGIPLAYNIPIDIHRQIVF